MVLRNVDPPKLCNGTRAIITQLLPYCLHVTITTGPNRGEQAMIPRIPLMPTVSGLPFSFRRVQFPVTVNFAITINNAQGQTLKLAWNPSSAMDSCMLLPVVWGQDMAFSSCVTMQKHETLCSNKPYCDGIYRYVVPTKKRLIRLHCFSLSIDICLSAYPSDLSACLPARLPD